MAGLADVPRDRAAHHAQAQEGDFSGIAHARDFSRFGGVRQPLPTAAIRLDTLSNLLFPDEVQVLQAARILFWPAFIFAAVMAALPKPPSLPIDRFGDKFEHALAFAVLTMFAQLGFRTVPRWRLAERLSFFGAMIELVQSIPALNRDCDIRDWVVDTAMVLLVTLGFVLADRMGWTGRGETPPPAP